jgi:hypothetical protein
MRTVSVRIPPSPPEYCPAPLTDIKETASSQWSGGFFVLIRLVLSTYVKKRLEALPTPEMALMVDDLIDLDLGLLLKALKHRRGSTLRRYPLSYMISIR